MRDSGNWTYEYLTTNDKIRMAQSIEDIYEIYRQRKTSFARFMSTNYIRKEIFQAEDSYKFHRTIMSLKIISYNCQSLNAKLDIVPSLLKDFDILSLQETLLTNDNDICENINIHFNAINIPSVRKLGQLYGRFGGG